MPNRFLSLRARGGKIDWNVYERLPKWYMTENQTQILLNISETSTTGLTWVMIHSFFAVQQYWNLKLSNISLIFLCFNSLYIWRETCWISLLLERWISDEWNELKTARSLTQLHSTTIFSFWREILGLLYEHWTVLTCWKNSLKCQELPIFLISPTNDRHPINNILFQLQS